MRHLKHRHQLGRTKEHRSALLSNLAAALFTHGRIQTTLAKAKALRPFAEKIITLAKKAEGASPDKALHYRRLAVARVRDRDAVQKLFIERASEFTNRPGGFTRIYKIGTRIGDGAEMALIQLISGEDQGYEKKKPAAKKKSATKKTASKKTAKKETSEPVAEETEAPVVEEAAAEEPSEETK